MNRYPQDKLPDPSEGFLQNAAHHPSLLRRRRARRRARRLESMRQARYQQLALRVEEILIGCGLTQADYSIGGGRVFHFPRVVSVVAGPPIELDIRILPGQMPDHFAAHASAIAYNLGVANVRVVPLGPSLIRLQLLPEPD